MLVFLIPMPFVSALFQGHSFKDTLVSHTCLPLVTENTLADTLLVRLS